LQCFFGPLDDGRGAGVGFEMTGLPAGATPCVGLIVDDDMATFAAVAVFTIDGQIADDDAAAHAGA
jgi:hypothetical protein